MNILIADDDEVSLLMLQEALTSRATMSKPRRMGRQALDIMRTGHARWSCRTGKCPR